MLVKLIFCALVLSVLLMSSSDAKALRRLQEDDSSDETPGFQKLFKSFFKRKKGSQRTKVVYMGKEFVRMGTDWMHSPKFDDDELKSIAEKVLQQLSREGNLGLVQPIDIDFNQEESVRLNSILLESYRGKVYDLMNENPRVKQAELMEIKRYWSREIEMFVRNGQRNQYEPILAALKWLLQGILAVFILFKFFITGIQKEG